jgi:hypothetical protein
MLKWKTAAVIDALWRRRRELGLRQQRNARVL